MGSMGKRFKHVLSKLSSVISLRPPLASDGGEGTYDDDDDDDDVGSESEVDMVAR